MLKQIKGTNFQTHSEVNLQFHPGVNVITGQSEAGKSAILRLIRWVALNKPSKKSIVKKGEKLTTGKLVFDNGTVAKKRDRDVTTFTVNDVTLKAVRSSIPEEISEITNIDDRNIQTQHNPYFLLVKSPGDIAKELNELAGLSVIDKLFSSINGELRKTKVELTTITELIPNVQEELQNFSDIQMLEKKVTLFGKLLTTQKQYEQELQSIKEVIEDLEDIDNEKRKNDKRLLYGESIDRALQRINRLTEIQKEHKSISLIIDDLEDILSQINEANKQAETQLARKQKLMQNVTECPICGTYLKED